MSSFINSPKHFSTIKRNIIRYLYTAQEKIRLPYSMENEYGVICNNRSFIEDKEKAVKEQINNFAKLQALCVNLQYKHHSDNLNQDIEVHSNEAIRETEAENVSKIQLLKLIKCSLYQLETEHLKELRELNNDEEKALNFMKKIERALAEDIIYNSEEFSKSEYCI